jgi:murein DD-endopeptidase MepM/ murein hydrolase activator NlpD
MTINKKRLIWYLSAFVSLSFLSMIGYTCAHRYYASRNLEQMADSVNVPPPVMLFDLPVDSFYISHGTVRQNQTFGSILSEYGLPASTVDKMSRVAAPVFNFRKFNYGNDYHLFISIDSIKKVCYFVYEESPVDYVVFNFTDSLYAYRGKKPVNTVLKYSTGSIQSSLWNTIQAQNLNPLLAIELSEIFAWTVDFFGIQQGDSFRVVYDEQYVDSISIGIGEIYGAYFKHAGHDFYAIPFMQDSIRDYFEINGTSLRKAFLKAPLKFSRISSKFSHSRFHPVLKIRRPHHGVDYSAPSGTPVVSIGDGHVIAKGWDGKGGGNYLKIKHNGIYSTAYLHLKGFAKDIHNGTFVHQGDIIGYVGSTGLSTGPHLDFRFYKNGSPVDPLKIEAPPVEPVKKENLQAFDSVKAVVLKKLNVYID